MDASRSDGYGQVATWRPPFDWIEQGGEFAPGFQRRLRREAREFTVGDGETLALDVTLTPDR